MTSLPAEAPLRRRDGERRGCSCLTNSAKPNSAMATSEWLQFFQDAGIPPGPALGYAVAFVDNRIHKNMLLDLTKELMKELGITVVGDVIAILRHAKVVHRQEMCRAASESLHPEPPAAPQRAQGVSPRDFGDHFGDFGAQRPRNAPRGAAGRMIANCLRRDSNLRSSRSPNGAGICVTVSNGAGSSSSDLPPVPGKRRRVTAEMEGKYIISLPKGTTARSRKILQLQAASGLGRTSVFERLGAESKAAAGDKPSGVFSRLGDSPSPPCHPADVPNPPGATNPPGDTPGDDGDDGDALPYAGVLKSRRECPHGVPEPQDGAVSSSVSSSVSLSVSPSVTSSLSPSVSPSVSPEGPRKVRSSGGSVFRRLGRKPD